MFERLKTLSVAIALAATLGTAVLTAAAPANAMPKAPAVEAANASVEIRHRGPRRFRRLRRLRRYRHLNCRWQGCFPKWRRCSRFYVLWRRTGRSYWLYRYRRCRNHGWLRTP